MLITLVRFFRRQWKRSICLSISAVSPRSGTSSGLRRLLRSTTSLKATVMPPPVKGWRIFIASPSITIPGTRLMEGGRNEFGILRSLPSSRALENEGFTLSGREGRTTLRRWAFTPPFLADAEARCSGISTNARVSCVPI